MKVDLILSNGTLVTPGGLIKGSILVEGEKIVGVTSKAHEPQADNVLDLEGKLVFPGAIDPHAHIHDIDYAYREDFTTGSRSAAAGGVTTFLNMPLVKPVIKREEIQEIIKIGESMAITDFSQHAGNMDEPSIVRVKEGIEAGVGAFKAFTCPPYHMTPLALMALMREIKKYNGIQLVHSEDYEIVTYLADKFVKERKKTIYDYFDSRPPLGEEEAIRRVTKWGEKTGVNLHVVHVSSKLGAMQIKDAKNRGVNVTAETCIQYLFLSRENAEKWGPYLKMNPTIKTREDNKALWQALVDGTLDMVATDHAPGTKEEKEIGREDIWKAWGGIPGIQDLFPMMLYETIHNHKLSMTRLYEITSFNAAKRFNLLPHKGIIMVGADADLVVVDPKKKDKVNTEKSYYKCGWNVYEGKPIVPIELTISRGEIIAENGEVYGKPGKGKFIPTAPKKH